MSQDTLFEGVPRVKGEGRAACCSGDPMVLICSVCGYKRRLVGKVPPERHVGVLRTREQIHKHWRSWKPEERDAYLYWHDLAKGRWPRADSAVIASLAFEMVCRLTDYSEVTYASYVADMREGA
jgi:hypothetical protein